MTNAEKYKDIIAKIRNIDGDVALSRETREPCGCHMISCDNCVWDEARSCVVAEREWLNQEYEESEVTVCDSIRLDDAIDKQIISDSIKHYGADMQATVCMEECAELIQAISKELRGKHDKNHLAEEIADVLICIDMLEQIYGISDSEIAKWIKIKQARTVERMKEGK